MDDVTIVSEDAVRLVREGGVVNRAEAAPGTLVPHIPITTPFTAEVLRTCPHCKGSGQPPSTSPLSGHCPRPCWGTGRVLVGTVMVVGVHHADQCYASWPPEGRGDHCHDDAEPDCWHWVVEPTGDNDDA